jgi:hypothetical protein
LHHVCTILNLASSEFDNYGACMRFLFCSRVIACVLTVPNQRIGRAAVCI